MIQYNLEDDYIEIKSRFHRGICKHCNQQRLLNKINLCVDCTTLEIYAENKEMNL